MLNLRDSIAATPAAAAALGASVTDRTSSIRITKLTVTPRQRNVFDPLDDESPTRGRLKDGSIADY